MIFQPGSGQLLSNFVIFYHQNICVQLFFTNRVAFGTNTVVFGKTIKTTDKKYHKLVFDDKKSQNCLVVGQTPAEKSQSS